MPLQNRVKELRARLGVNQQELGSLVGASRQTVSLIERGDYHPSVLLALRIAKVFGVPLEEVFFITGEEESNETEQLALGGPFSGHHGPCRLCRRRSRRFWGHACRFFFRRAGCGGHSIGICRACTGGACHLYLLPAGLSCIPQGSAPFLQRAGR